MAHTISEEVIKAMAIKIEEQEREKAALEETIVTLTAQLKAKEDELSEQVKTKDEEHGQIKRELDATEGGRFRVQRELNQVREAVSLLRYASKKLCTQYAVTASWRRPSIPTVPSKPCSGWPRPRAPAALPRPSTRTGSRSP